MLSLDFKKAFDKVEHSLIWKALRAFGFWNERIMLIQGLLTHGFAKVHSTGMFIKKIHLECDVQQGVIFPLAFGSHHAANDLHLH
jgi:hypothetical protein